MADETNLGAAAAGSAQVTMNSQPAALDARPLTPVAASDRGEGDVHRLRCGRGTDQYAGHPREPLQPGWVAWTGRRASGRSPRSPTADYFTHMAFGVGGWISSGSPSSHVWNRTGGRCPAADRYICPDHRSRVRRRGGGGAQLGGEDLHVLVAMLSPAQPSIWRGGRGPHPGISPTRFLSRPCSSWRLRSGARTAADGSTGCAGSSCYGPIHGSVTMGVGLVSSTGGAGDRALGDLGSGLCVTPHSGRSSCLAVGPASDPLWHGDHPLLPCDADEPEF